MLTRMNRAATAAALVAVAVLPSYAGAAVSKPAPQVVDAPGDFPAPSMDVLQGRVSLANGKSLDALEFRIKLSAAPLVPAEFAFGFNIDDCTRYTVGSHWAGSFLTTTLTKSTCDSLVNEDVPGARLSVRAEGTDVVFVLRDVANYGIKYGTQLNAMIAWATEAQVAVFALGSVADKDAAPGDIGWGKTHYTVGSELTRKRR